jgi:sugar lactone lactonase YvrE
MYHKILHVRSWMLLLAVGAIAAAAGCPQSSAPPSSSGTSPSVTTGQAQVPVEEQNAAGPPVKQAELLVSLPLDICNTPDAMALLPDGSFVLSVPNFNEPSLPPILMRITADNKAEKLFDLPPNPDTNESFGPLGVCVTPSGDLLVADYQMKGERKSRVVRIKMQDGKAVEAVPAITGFSVSNAVIVHDGHVYVSDTQIDLEAKPVLSGVFRFKLDELEGEPVALTAPLKDDPHLIATIETFNEELPLGADGLAFDDQGNLYVGNFSDGTVHRIQFDAEGNVASNEIFAKTDFMKSADGLIWDPRRKRIYVADSKANAIQMVYPDGTVETLARNGDTDGQDGGMDQPCEPLLRGDEVIVSNMDWPVPGCINQKYDKPCTLSVIKLAPVQP